MSAAPPTRPHPEQFSDLRTYLQAMIAYLKATRRAFSYRQFSKAAGFSSPNFLKLVAEGERNLSPSSIPKFAKGLGLDEKERDTFEVLALLSLAQSDEERNRYYGRLRQASEATSPARRLEAAQFDIYSHWFVLPIRDLLVHPEFDEDPEWIARAVRPRISAARAAMALRLLEQTGLARRDDSGRLVQAERTISTGPQVRSLAIRNYHRQMLALAQDKLDTVALDRRDYSSLTLSMTGEQLAEVKRRVERFRAELIELIDGAGPVPADADVFQVGFQVFPLTDINSSARAKGRSGALERRT